jgi:hypothetical protein
MHSTRTRPVPHVNIGSPSGRTFLSLRFSRRSILNFLLAVGALVILALGSLWAAQKLWSKPPGSIGTTYQLPSGPWGTITARPILIEAPKSLLSPNFRLGDGRWYFQAAQAGEVQSFLRAAGLTPEQAAAVLPTLQPVSGRPGLMAALPSAELIRTLSPTVRSALYDKLALVPENFAQVEPFRITDLYLDDWLDAGTLPPELIAQVKGLLWRRGSSLLFSDYNTVADSLTSPALKLELLRQLTRKASLVIELGIPDHGDVESLVSYWGTGGRADKVRPLLASLAQSGGAAVDISNLLPVFARQRLYRFPDALPGTDLGPGCHWSAFNFFNNNETDESLHTPEGVEKVLREGYVAATGEPRFGDIILLTLPDGSSIHSAVHIADGIVFTKNGPSLATPYVFSTMEDMLAFYPSSEKITLTYYRRAGK